MLIGIKMLTPRTIRLVEALDGRSYYVRELSSIMSSRAVDSALEELENAGLVEKIIERAGPGRPRSYCTLTVRGLVLAGFLDEIRFNTAINRIRERAPVAAGVSTSLADHYKAPLVLGWKDVVVPARFACLAEKIVEKIRETSRWKLDVGEIWKGFESRCVESEGIPYLGLEDLLVAVVLEDHARLTSCLPGVLYDHSSELNFELLLELAERADRPASVVKFSPVDRVSGAVFGKLGGILDISNRLAKKKLVPDEELKKFEMRAPKRALQPRVIYTHKFTKMGLIPFKEDPVDAEIRERWRVRMPTFHEVWEIWELGGYEKHVGEPSGS